MSRIQQPFSTISIGVIALLLFWVSSNINWGKDNWKSMLESDAKGYYAYLPAIFIYQDLNFSFLEEIEEKYEMPHLYYDYRSGYKGKVINKYYAGTALLQLPFFMLGHGITAISGGEMDGYGKWYLIMVNVAAIFYHLLGLYCVRRLLLLWSVPDKLIALLLFACSFGTNLFVYTVVEPGMSHVYSFALLAFFSWKTTVYFHQKDRNALFWSALALGVIILLRPINGLVVFALPLLAGEWKFFKEGVYSLLKKPITISFILLLPLVVFFLQALIYYLSTGYWWVYSYGEETFYFSEPHFLAILFSYRKGLFLYTPFYFLPFLLSYFLFKRSVYLFVSWCSFFCLITYVFSSWWMWYYGGSFSSRVYVEYLPLFVLVLGLSWQAIRSVLLRNTLVTLLLGIILLCQFQSYQYRYYVIHYSEMNKEKYWDVFLKL
jgi:hypothetical protein